MKIIAFAASSSKNSINKKLASYVAGLVEGVDVEVLDLNDFELPLFSVDKEVEVGQPPLAQAFLAKIASADGLIVSFAEHNGGYSAAYKNLFDWCSRINKKVFADKPMLLLATSPGGRGGASVLAEAVASIPRFGGQVVASVSIPSFFENFDVVAGVLKNETLNAHVGVAVKALNDKIVGN